MKILKRGENPAQLSFVCVIFLFSHTLLQTLTELFDLNQIKITLFSSYAKLIVIKT